MRIKNVHAFIALPLVPALLAPPATGETTTLEPAADATIYELDGQQLANGAGQYLFAGRTFQGLQGLRRRGLIRFDCAPIPNDAVVTDARLEMQLVQLQGGPSEIRLHRSNSVWTSGASDPSGNEGQGAPALANDCTWTYANFDGAGSGTIWSTPGGDFVPTASATVLTIEPGMYQWSSPAMIDDVRDFVREPRGNFGWFLLGEENQPGTARRFDGGDAEAGGGVTPKLVIEWTRRNPCVGDLDGDGSVDGADLSLALGAWWTTEADLNGDGTTDASDLAMLLGAWGPCT